LPGTFAKAAWFNPDWCGGVLNRASALALTATSILNSLDSPFIAKTNMGYNFLYLSSLALEKT